MSDRFDKEIAGLIREDLQRPVPQEVRRLADQAIARSGGRRSEGGDIVAILYYGSCYRDGTVGDGMVDLYLLAGEQGITTKGRFGRLLNHLVPPDVHYVQCRDGERMLRAKYAILTLRQFASRMQPECGNPYFWARFAQPTGIVEVHAGCRAELESSFVRAIRTLFGHARHLASPGATLDQLWTGILRETYRTELRVEKPERASQIYHANRNRFDRIAQILADAPIEPTIGGSWAWRRIEGKALSVLRLVKAAFTFAGGADYLAWKIERHSGHALQLTDWQRRHPILAAGPILWRLWRQRIVN
ncbi:MAG: hypothetical protein R3C97_14240 [Geminicoccaceae bacterium]